MLRIRASAFELALGAIGASLVSLSFVFARTGIPSFIPPAPLVRAGIASPLTGMTRSFVAFSNGDIARALWWHPLGPLCFIVAATTPVIAMIALRGLRLAVLLRIASSRALWLAVLGVFLVVWVRQMMVIPV